MSQIKLILSVIVSSVLFIGGVILLLTKSSFWSLFLGIPATQIGIVCLIYSFDKLSTNTLDEEESQLMNMHPAKSYQKKNKS